MPSAKRRHEKNRESVEAWTHPAGTPVTVARANGRRLSSWTASEAFLLDGKHAFVRVQGIPGNVRLSRVRLRKARQTRRTLLP